MVLTNFTGTGVGFGFGIGCGFGVGWGFGGIPLHTFGLGIGGGCGVGFGLGWGFGSAFGSQYRSSRVTFHKNWFKVRRWLTIYEQVLIFFSYFTSLAYDLFREGTR